MTVKELKQILKSMNDDIEVVMKKCHESEYHPCSVLRTSGFRNNDFSFTVDSIGNVPLLVLA